jgi:hypothetical protein
MLPASIPEAVARLLWDVDLAAFDADRDRALVFERVMSRGTWEAMKWLRQRYPVAALADFVRTRGPRVLSPRDLAYWALICDVTVPGAEHDAGGGRPRWAGE